MVRDYYLSKSLALTKKLSRLSLLIDENYKFITLSRFLSIRLIYRDNENGPTHTYKALRIAYCFLWSWG